LHCFEVACSDTLEALSNFTSLGTARFVFDVLDEALDLDFPVRLKPGIFVLWPHACLIEVVLGGKYDMLVKLIFGHEELRPEEQQSEGSLRTDFVVASSGDDVEHCGHGACVQDLLPESILGLCGFPGREFAGSM